MTTDRLSADAYAAIDEIVRIGRSGVARALAANRRLGVPNVYSINGRLYYENATGELSLTDPYPEAKSDPESRRDPEPRPPTDHR